jgi:hypothetical protein
MTPAHGTRSVIMSKAAAWRGVGAFLLILTAAPVFATPVIVGAFDYQLDPTFGPVLTVEDYAGSPVSFTSMVAHLFDGSTDVEDFTFTPTPLLAGGFPPQGFDLLGLTGLSAGHATLDLSFAGPAGSIQVGSLTGLSFTQDSAGVYSGTFCTSCDPNAPVPANSTLIDFTPAAIPVPEPTTLLLVGSGLVAAIRRRARGSRVGLKSLP